LPGHEKHKSEIKIPKINAWDIGLNKQAIEPAFGASRHSVNKTERVEFIDNGLK
jgi:hypothetical protein